MIRIEPIANGFIAIFKNTEKKRVKVFFPDIDNMTAWLKTQFPPPQKG